MLAAMTGPMPSTAAQFVRRRRHDARPGCPGRGPPPGLPSGPSGGSRARPAAGSAVGRSRPRCPHQVGGRNGGKSLELGQLGHRQVVEVRRVDDQPGRHQLDDALLAQPFDVHGRAGGIVDDALDPLRRAVDVGAVGVALALEASQWLATGGARRSGISTAACGACGTPGPASTGPTISGMTSPALRTMTMSPGRTSFRRTWSSLCSVATSTVEPPRRRAPCARTASHGRCARSTP